MKFINYIALICSVLMISSCDSFLDKQEDEALTFEKIWSKRSTVEKSLIMYGDSCLMNRIG